MRERRRYIRVSQKAQLTYRVLPTLKSHNFLTNNISQGGLRFVVHEFIAKDSLMSIRLTLDKIPFSFEAVVRVQWVAKVRLSETYEVGAEFMNIPRKAADHLMGYIRCVIDNT